METCQHNGAPGHRFTGLIRIKTVSIDYRLGSYLYKKQGQTQSAVNSNYIMRMTMMMICTVYSVHTTVRTMMETIRELPLVTIPATWNGNYRHGSFFAFLNLPRFPTQSARCIAVRVFPLPPDPLRVESVGLGNAAWVSFPIIIINYHHQVFWWW